jgi:ABC-2 type transport system ATP-binding protein
MGRAPAIAVSGLTKRYGAVTAVEDLTFAVPPGSITALLGGNGAGKTTTRLADAGPLSGQLEVTGGTVTFDGARIARMRPDRRRPANSAACARGRTCSTSTCGSFWR